MHISPDRFVARPNGEMNRIKVDEEIFDHVGKRVSEVVPTKSYCMRLLIILASVPFFILMSCKQNQDQKKDEQAIRNIIIQMTEGFNKHDAKAATEMYTTNADFVNVRGDKYTGVEEIREKLAVILSTRAKEATLKSLNTTVRFLNPELAIAHVTNELSGLVDSAGLALPSHRELSIRVFIKEKGVWRVTAFHNTMIRPF